MALRYVILSLVAAKPRSGYDIVKSFDQSVGQIWQASHQQVYRELGKLAKDGWLEFEREAQTDKPDRKVYTITPDGRKSLDRWISGPSDTPAYRSPILVRLLALPVVGPEPLLPAVREARAEYEDKLRSYVAIEQLNQGNFDPANMDSTDLALHMALRMAIAFTRPMLTWCDETIDALERKALANRQQAATTSTAAPMISRAEFASSE